MKPLIEATEEERAEYGIIDGPAWPNHCNHPEGTYLCTFEIFRNNPDKLKVKEEPYIRVVIDLFVFGENGPSRQGACMRDGPEGSNYYSPGSPMDIVRTAAALPNHEPYERAARILQHFGQFIWTPKAQPEQKVCDLCGKPCEELNPAPGVDGGGKFRHATCIPL